MKKIGAKTSLENLAVIISEHLESRGMQASLVGGAVVTIYSNNEYQSRDLDFISSDEPESLESALKELGFIRKGKNFVHPNTEFTVEFPTGPIAIGNDIHIVPEGEYRTKTGTLKLFSPTQCVMDRLAWFYHYRDRQCLDQALAVAAKNEVSLGVIKKWSAREGELEKYEFFLKKLKALK